ncbi:MAG: hypothetical protein BJ554DRAFT_1035 [Olpidium bornovanus]|uniref:MEDS domain-containing protein n=1 Tax=Olpidium bornovanus TaxID=278681 RepID=A0A8H8DHQ4_9FUNG|nr:MAG: hypothetical protein BJ554DRAFT_1035 [Olpidium bornovanus]
MFLVVGCPFRFTNGWHKCPSLLSAPLRPPRPPAAAQRTRARTQLSQSPTSGVHLRPALRPAPPACTSGLHLRPAPPAPHLRPRTSGLHLRRALPACSACSVLALLSSPDAQDAQAGPATVPRTCFPWGLRDPISERPLVLAESTVRRATTSSYLSSCISKEGKLISAVASQHAARKTVESLQVKDHVCGVYNSDEDRWRDIKLFLKTGALNGEKLIYIVDAVTGSAAVRHFTRVFEENRLRKSPLPEYPPIGPGTRGTPGVVTGNSAEARRTSSDRTGDDDFVLNLQVLIDSKQLVFLHYEDAYTQYGKFEPERMVEFLDNCATTAKAEGWAGLRVVGAYTSDSYSREMSWTLRTFTTIDQLHYYEAIVNEVFRVREASAICHYDRRLFEAQDLINIISTHPTTSFGSNVYGKALDVVSM